MLEKVCSSSLQTEGQDKVVFVHGKLSQVDQWNNVCGEIV
jgi:hypothetical protein